MHQHVSRFEDGAERPRARSWATWDLGLWRVGTGSRTLSTKRVCGCCLRLFHHGTSA